MLILGGVLRLGVGVGAPLFCFVDFGFFFLFSSFSFYDDARGCLIFFGWSLHNGEKRISFFSLFLFFFFFSFL